MKLFVVFIPLFIIYTTAACQDTTSNNSKEIIGKVIEAQELIKTVFYTLERTDTLITGDTRTMTGRVMIRVDKNDSIFGFEFGAKMEKIHGESIYGGRVLYETNDDEKKYTVVTDPSLVRHALWQYSGQIILPDLVKLDTSGAIQFESWKDKKFIYLRMNYADLTQYDVTKRSKTLTIDTSTMLPVAMRSHQESLGKIQDLYYHIKEIQVNDPSFHYEFSSPGFLTNYSQQILEPGRPLLRLQGQQAPAFTLSTFDKKEISLEGLRGKIILLDFWEVWCGPCIESMPKVQHLYDTYKDKGLHVFGIINDIKQLGPSKLLVQKRGFSFPMLTGNEQLKKDYKINAIPLYILIGKSGKIIFLSAGYSDELETAIREAIPE